MGTAPIVPQSRWEKLELPIKAASTVVSAVSLGAVIWAGVARIVAEKPHWDLVSVTLGIGTVLLFLSSLTLLVVALRRRNVVFLPDCADLSSVDARLGIAPTLQDLAGRRGKLTVLGRTCFRWFSESKPDRTGTEDAPGLLEAAAEKGANLCFYVMSPSKVLELEGFAKDPEKRAHLQKQLKEVEESFRQAKERLRRVATRSADDPSKRLRLAFTARPVANSKSLLKDERGKLLRFVCELGTDFEVKPAIAFLGETHTEKDAKFLRALSSDLENVEGYIDADGQDGAFEMRKRGKHTVETLAREYHFAPNLRKNSSLSLARTYLGHFRHLKYPASFGRIPPVTVQLHVTHQCTTKCKMCRHYRIGEISARKGASAERELTVNELKLVIDAIAKLGVQTLIVSGGEPLHREEELFEVLQRAKDSGLKTGLLTNGIKPGNVALSLDDCRRLFNSCEWVQLSIDSFDPEKYLLIRRTGGLETVLASLDNLRKALSESTAPLRDHLEICYTIQKDNVGEVPHAKELLRKLGLDWCWELLRFKYAHGPQPATRPDGKPLAKDDEFLCKAEDIAALMQSMTGDQHFAYLSERFRAPDVADGKPTRNMSGGKCQALNLTCTIDAFGYVYPCCFLFDDNNDRADVRVKYRVGSLRPHGEAVDDTCARVLKDAWEGNQLNELRSRDLMVDENACCYCTRHVYNNEFLNKLHGILETYGQHFDLEALEEEILPKAAAKGGPYWI